MALMTGQDLSLARRLEDEGRVRPEIGRNDLRKGW